MQKSIDLQTEQLNKLHKRKASRRRVFRILSGIVVFFTTYALILPAITWERTLVCELEEHTHSDACYETVVVAASDEQVCGKEEHTHTDECYLETKTLVCTLEENEEHSHTEDCYVTERVLTCNLEEHTHTDECINHIEEHEEKTLICQKEEHTHTDSCFDAPPAEDPGYYCGQISHTHNENCYYADGTLRCTIPEHIHTDECQSNKNADLESAEYWQQLISQVEFTGNWHRDVISVAQSQLGYRESSSNFIIEDGSRKGYTRYGAWYGIPYGEWCAMFCSFCLHYAGVDTALMPINSVCNNWVASLKELSLYHSAAEITESGYLPQSGDLVFYDWDAYDPAAPENRWADHVGFVYDIIPATDDTPAQIRTLEGNWGDTVQILTRDLNYSCFMGFGTLPEMVSACANSDDSCVNLSARCNVSGSYNWQWQYSADGEIWQNIDGATSLSCVTAAQSADGLYRLVGTAAIAGDTGSRSQILSSVVTVGTGVTQAAETTLTELSAQPEAAAGPETEPEPVETSAEPLEGDTGILSEWEELESAEELVEGEEYEIVAEELSEESDFTVYDITPEEGAVVPEEGVKVYIPAACEMKVFGLEEDTLVWHEDAEFVTVEGETFMCFTAYHFSVYGVADDTSDSDSSLALTASLTSSGTTTVTTEKVTSLDALSDGDTVIIMNNLNSRYVVDTVNTVNNTSKLSLTTDESSATYWTVVYDGTYYKLKNSSGNYLTAGLNSTYLTSDINSAAVLIFESDGNAIIYKTVYGTKYYVNDWQNGGQYATGWNENNHGSKNTIYLVTETQDDDPDTPVEPDDPVTTESYWVKCDSPDDLNSDDVIMIVSSDGYALGVSSGSATSAAASFTAVTGTEYYTVSGTAATTAYQFKLVAQSTSGQYEVLSNSDSTYGITLKKNETSAISDAPSTEIYFSGSDSQLQIYRTGKNNTIYYLNCANGTFSNGTLSNLTIYKQVDYTPPVTAYLDLSLTNIGTGDGTVTDSTNFTFTLKASDGTAAVYTSYCLLDSDGNPGESVAYNADSPAITLHSGQTVRISGLAEADYTLEEDLGSVSDKISDVTAALGTTSLEVTRTTDADSSKSTAVTASFSYSGVKSLEVKNCLDQGYTITFDFRDGTTQTLTTTADGKLTQSYPVKSRAGMNLDYWSTERDNASTALAYSSSYAFTGDTTLYAHWSYVSSGGSVGTSASVDFTKELREETAYTDSENYENLFDIDLYANPESSAIETLVLVFDLSSSMDNQCMNCGLKHGSNGDKESGKTYSLTGWDGTVHSETACTNFVRRLDVVKDQANIFIEKLNAKLQADDRNCYVSVVGFNAGAFTLIDDVNLKEDSGKDAIINTITNIDSYCTTNTALSSGMYLGYQRLQALNNAHSVAPANSCVLLLSDGVPTSVLTGCQGSYVLADSSFYVGAEAVANATSADYMEKWKNIWSGYDNYEWNAENMDGYNASTQTGTSFSLYQLMAPPYIAEQIRSYGSALHTISLGKNMDFGTKLAGNAHGYVSGIGLNNIDYLSTFSDTAFFITTEDGLEEYYESLIDSFTTKIEIIEAKDPMSDNVEFAGFTAATGEEDITVSSDKTKVYSGSTLLAYYDSSTRTITWNPEAEGTISYKVRLKNEMSGFNDWDETSADYLTNGVTQIDYKIIIGDNVTSVTRTADIPYVHGWLGELSFTKVGGITNDSTAQALAGVNFTIHHDPDDCPICSHLDSGIRAVIDDITVVSDENGVVSFTGLPSGHSYTMTETEYIGYSPANDYTITVAYGVTSVQSVGDDKGYWTIDGDGDYQLFNLYTNSCELPETGGSGTAAIYVAGAALLAISALVYLPRRRRKPGRHSY